MKKVRIKKGLTKISSPFSSHYYKSIGLFLEIAVVQTFETFTVTGFVLSHFVNGIMDSVEVQSLSASGDTLLVFASTRFSVHSLSS